MRRTRLVVDACPFLHPPTGIGRYAKEVLDHLDHDRWSLRYHYGPLINYKPEQLSNLPPIMRVSRLNALYVQASQILQGNAYRKWDLYWEPNNVLPFPVRPERFVVTHHDLSWFHHPQWHPASLVKFFNKRIGATLERSDTIITGSTATKAEIADTFGIPLEKIVVIPHGIDTDWFSPRPQSQIDELRATYKLPERYMLAVCSQEPRKNLELLLRAWAKIPQSDLNGAGLVLVGGTRLESQTLTDLLDESHNVHRLGYVDDAHLPILYSGANLMVYPSFYEGFGLPPLEALSCGCPVAAVSCPGLKDLGIHIGVSWLHPYDPQQLTDLLRERLGPRLDLPHSALSRVRELTWARSSLAHEALFRQLVASAG